MSAHQKYLTTLRRIPDDVILSMATRNMNMDHAQTCLCGWAVREALARAAGTENASKITGLYGVTWRCREAFGGSQGAWADIFWGVVGKEAPLIERAFVARVLECVA